MPKNSPVSLCEYRNDPYLIGYFLRNEPQWAFGDHDIAFEMFATKDLSFSKMAFVKWLSDEYSNNISAFNKAWNLEMICFFGPEPSKRLKTIRLIKVGKIL